MIYKTLLTERLRLEPITEHHLPAMLDMHLRNAAQFHGRMPSVHKTLEDTRRMLPKDGNTQRFVVITKRTKFVVGSLALANMTGMPLSSATIGYMFDAAHGGQGYAREAVARLVTHGFRALKLHRIEANIEPNNKRSLKLIKALAFRKEGISPRLIFLGGAWRDQARFALTTEEWPH